MLDIIMFLITTIAVITDIKYKKVFNYLTFPLMLIGIITNSYLSGFQGFIFSMKGLVLAFILFMIANILIKNIGFGDVKLLMGIGACMGSSYVCNVYIISLISSLLINGLLNPRRLWVACKKIYGLFMMIFLSKKLQYIDFKSNNNSYIFAPYILIGCIITTVYYIYYGQYLITRFL